MKSMWEWVTHSPGSGPEWELGWLVCKFKPHSHFQANSRLKQIEKEYTQKLSKSSQIIAELQTTISSLKEESSRQQLAAERRLQDAIQKFEDEKQQLIRDNDQAIKALQDELETRCNQVRSAEKKLQHKELEAQEQQLGMAGLDKEDEGAGNIYSLYMEVIKIKDKVTGSPSDRSVEGEKAR
ncbi:centrosomal protein [Cricetulus griseus]|nr:centrosomal protein [Cricetulus griseus]